MLGTGTPVPDPKRSGPAVAIVVNNRAYLFDAGAGVVRRAEAAAEKHGFRALQAPYLTRLFLTHLHSDHTLGYADVILTSWVVGRTEPLQVFGPKGTQAMTEHLHQAYSEDIAMRTNGLEHLSASMLQVDVTEISPGLVYRDPNISVRAVPVAHGLWKYAFGFVAETKDRRIVLSGDTAPCPALVEACAGCDVLVHEVYSAAQAATLAPESKRYHETYHTSTAELAELASRVKPKLLVLYHQLYFGDPDEVDLVKEVRTRFSGDVKNGEDLTIY